MRKAEMDACCLLLRARFCLVQVTHASRCTNGIGTTVVTAQTSAGAPLRRPGVTGISDPTSWWGLTAAVFVAFLLIPFLPGVRLFVSLSGVCDVTPHPLRSGDHGVRGPVSNSVALLTGKRGPEAIDSGTFSVLQTMVINSMSDSTVWTYVQLFSSKHFKSGILYNEIAKGQSRLEQLAKSRTNVITMQVYNSVTTTGIQYRQPRLQSRNLSLRW